MSSVQGTAVFEATPTEEGELYCYQALPEDVVGPGVPDLQELDSSGYAVAMQCVWWLPPGPCHNALCV